MRAGLVRQAGNVTAGMEVAGAPVLAVGHRRRAAVGDPGHRTEQPFDVTLAGAEAGTGADRPRHRAPVPAAHFVPVTTHLRAGEAEQPHQVRVRAEAAVPYVTLLSYPDGGLAGFPRPTWPATRPRPRPGTGRTACSSSTTPGSPGTPI